MRDAQLVELARRYRELGAEIGRLSAERETTSAAIVGELEARNATSIAAKGLTVTLTSRRIGFDVEALRARLTPTLFRKVTMIAVDGNALEEAVKAGKVAEADRKAAELRSRSFPKVTEAAA